ncbi:MAG: hypothetical protein NC222_06830 [Staphylococcus sp.]|nr:hypothetical protein [Staphylococcus sp.]
MNNENKIELTEQDVLDIENKVKEASPYKIKIIENHNKQFKALKKEFTNLLFDAFPDYNDKECDEYKEIKKVFGDMISAIYKDEKANSNERTTIEKLVVKLMWLIKVSRYLGYSEVDNALIKFGLEVKTDSLNKMSNFFNDSIKDTLQAFVEDGIKIQKQEIEEGEKILNTFEQLPSNLKFDSKSNPSGLKLSKFETLTNFEAIKSINLEKAKNKLEKLEDTIDNKTLSDMLLKTVASKIVRAEE